MADAGAAAAAVRADGRLAAAATREVKRGLAAAGEGTYPSTADLLNTQAPTRARGRALTLIFMTPVSVSLLFLLPNGFGRGKSDGLTSNVRKHQPKMSENQCRRKGDLATS